jgi:hypothetical protein
METPEASPRPVRYLVPSRSPLPRQINDSDDECDEPLIVTAVGNAHASNNDTAHHAKKHHAHGVHAHGGGTTTAARNAVAPLPTTTGPKRAARRVTMALDGFVLSADMEAKLATRQREFNRMHETRLIAAVHGRDVPSHHKANWYVHSARTFNFISFSVSFVPCSLVVCLRLSDAMLHRASL